MPTVFADTHTLACKSNPSRCACRGPREVTAAVSRASPSRHTRAPSDPFPDVAVGSYLEQGNISKRRRLSGGRQPL